MRNNKAGFSIASQKMLEKNLGPQVEKIGWLIQKKQRWLMKQKRR
jgi:hypothetical protein|tara:strand:- start:197 stop:331 length:135 start_codon:yes stop_codon:yes gene_type:complete